MAVFGFLYGLLVYVFFLATFVYAIGFVGNLPLLPKTIDSGAPRTAAEALLVNVALLGAVRRAAQRDGAARLQALVDAHRARADRAQHLRARCHRGAGAAAVAMAPDRRAA